MLECELHGVHSGLLVAKFRNHRDVIMEGDNLSIISSLKNEGPCPINWRLYHLFVTVVFLVASINSVIFNGVN